MSIFKRNTNDPRNATRDAIKSFLPKSTTPIGAYGLAKHVASEARDGEQVVDALAGTDGKAPALVVVTDRRVFYTSGVSGASRRHVLDYNQITEVATGTDLWRGKFLVRAGSESYELEKVYGDAVRVANAIRDRLSSPSSAPVAPSGSDELSRLVELYQQGLLSDEEFAAAKSRALGL